MSAAGPDYEGEFKRRMRDNAAAVIPALDKRAGWLMNKIAKAAKRFDIKEADIVSALRECEVLRYYLAIDPTNQSMHEATAAKFIGAIEGVEDFRRGTSSGKRALFIIGGRIVGVKERNAFCAGKPRAEHTKSVDFLWNFGGKQFYGYHKHTHEGGGAQDHQWNDVRKFLSESAPNDLPECVFIALCDGAFYGTKNGARGGTKMEALGKLAETAALGNVFAMTTADLPVFLHLHYGDR